MEMGWAKQRETCAWPNSKLRLLCRTSKETIEVLPQDRKEMLNRVKRTLQARWWWWLWTMHIPLEDLGSRWDGTSMISEDAGRHGKDRKNIREQKNVRKAQWQRWPHLVRNKPISPQTGGRSSVCTFAWEKSTGVIPNRLLNANVGIETFGWATVIPLPTDDLGFECRLVPTCHVFKH